MVSVVGGGLVGSMVSCFLARRGFTVDLYEMRGDIRRMEHVQGKSINLAISERGRSALRSLGLEDKVLEEHAIPMKGRLIHDIAGKRRVIPYGNKGQCIFSVGRRYLNELLLTEAEKSPNVKVHFDSKIVVADFESGRLTFAPTMGKGAPEVRKGDVVIGCDGAYSSVRRSMMKATRFDFSQSYIDHGYIELNIPPTEEGDYAMEVNYLHIWPRGSFMLIALPNQDKSYTVTLFMPFEHFDDLKEPKDVLQFFDTYFADSIPLIGADQLVTDFFSTKASPLVSVKCKPYHYKNKALLIGDAAHAMVPFFGQGMNCGFEDCLVLDELLGKNNCDLGLAFPEFTRVRTEDCHVICDLAMYNYIEMRLLVNSPMFLLRKKVDTLLNWLQPTSWIPLYGMVTFTRLPYSKCLQLRQKQDSFLSWAALTSVAALIVSVLYSKLTF